MGGTTVPEMFAGELIACIADARDPSVHELFTLARSMWTTGAAGRSAFDWDRLEPTDLDRLRAVRAACAALAGSADPPR